MHVCYLNDTVSRELTDSGSVFEGLRVEWVKARARAERWREEVLLLEEEMRRAIVYCRWKASFWDNAETPRESFTTQEEFVLHEGVQAYARRQAEYECRRALQWEDKWRAIRERAALVLTSQLSQTGSDVLAVPALVVELDLDYENGIGDEESSEP